MARRPPPAATTPARKAKKEPKPETSARRPAPKTEPRLPFNSPHWVDLNGGEWWPEAVRRAGRPEFAARELHQAMVERRVRTKAKWTHKEKIKQRLLKPNWWFAFRAFAGEDRIDFYRIAGAGDPLNVVYFVWLPDLADLFSTPVGEPAPSSPTAASSPPLASPASSPPATLTSPPPRPRGRPATHDWHTICGEIARRCIDPSGHIAVPAQVNKLADEVLDWCGVKLGPEPARSELLEAVRRVCDRLREGPEPPVRTGKKGRG